MTPCARCRRPACDLTRLRCTRTDCALREPLTLSHSAVDPGRIASGSSLTGRATCAVDDLPPAVGGALLLEAAA